MKTRFLWDSAKADTNLKKHGVDFEMAALAFLDPFALTIQDRIENGEWRWQTFGMVENRVLLMVAHTIWEEDEDGHIIEVIRIISAREANSRERKRYEQEPRSP